MDANRIRAEIFETYYNDIKKRLKEHDYVAARKSMILASKYMYERAKKSNGDSKAVNLRYADDLYGKIFDIDKIIEAKRRKGKNTASNNDIGKSPEDRIVKNKSSGEEDDEKKVFEAMSVPNISFNDVVGLNDVKEAVQDKIINPRKYPELYEKYKIKTGGGILMYGPPGTGKTMVAKAIAHEVNAEFFSLRCSELVSRYFGGTEQNIGLLFETARSKKNSVIFFDEFEALAVGRDRNNSTVMRRVVSELLTQMQGIKEDAEKGSTLLVVAATNMPWMMDTAFLRPGRFDECIYVGLPDDEARRGILEKNIKEIPCADSIDYQSLVERTSGFNCADIVQLVNKAKATALKREEKNGNSGGMCMKDFDKAMETSRSSVMKSDIEKLMRWKKETGR